MSHPVPEESPRDKPNAPLNHPVQEENPKDESITPLPHPVQEESPTDKSKASMAHPVQEENPIDKTNASLSSPVQEESPRDKSNPPLPHSVQEESSKDESNTSLPRPVQEESPTHKSDPPLPHPVQEESPKDKADISLPCPVQQESSLVKSDALLPYSVSEHSASIQTKTEGDLTPARDQRLTGETGPSTFSTGERAIEGIRPGVVKNAATRTVRSNAVGAADGVTNSEYFNQTGTSRAKSSGGSSFKPGAALGQTWQGTIGSGIQRRANPITRSAPKEVQERLLHEASNSPSSEMLGLDELCTVPESGGVESQSEKQQCDDAVSKSTTAVVTKEKNAGTGVKSDGGLHRSRLKRGPGVSLLLRTFPEESKSVEASSNVGACSNAASTYARSSSSSRESPHRKERPSREDAISDGPLPAGTVADGNEAMRAARNGEALSAGNHARDERSSDSRNNLSGDTQSSADGDSTVIMLEDANPEDDPEKSCPSHCRPM